MNKKNNSLLQKLKDNAFYLALGIGMFAILAVVAVYTLEQNEINLAQNDLDLNTASEYDELTTQEAQVYETSGKTADQKGKVDKTTEAASVEEETTAKQMQEELPKEREYTLPTVSPAGELDFTSEKTISWPLNGEVILPYSMDTTVYYKTLDQYQCNPGMLISGNSGDTVKNVYLGQVKKVTSDNTYGNMVTVYLGNNYSVVYGQLDTIYVKEGDYVKAGDAIGTIGTPTDTFVDEGNHLYFQMLENETPIDPMLFVE